MGKGTHQSSSVDYGNPEFKNLNESSRNDFKSAIDSPADKGDSTAKG